MKLARFALPGAVVLAAVSYFVIATVLSGGSSPTADVDPVDVRADGPHFVEAGDLAAASDVVVEAVVVDVERGRTITDPERPDVGIATQIAHLEDLDSGARITVEQERSLLDGTPITVNGLPALEVGDHGVAFLIRGGSDEFPYSALVNEQAWLTVVDDAIDAGPSAAEIGNAWCGRRPDDLLAVVRSD